MGMFDWIECEMPLPEKPDTAKHGFQTKDTPDQMLTTYTITSDGLLMWRPYTYEDVPRSERPYPDAPDDDPRSWFGASRKVEREPECLDFHGDIRFYTSDEDGGWWEYKARFTEGVCAGIEIVETPNRESDNG